MDATKEKMIIELDEFARHITLYAKGHYRKNEIIKDLKIIISIISGVEKHHISIINVYEAVINAFLEISKHEKIRADLFWKELVRMHWLRTIKTNIAPKDLIEHLIGFISIIQINGRVDDKIIELGQPDGKIAKELLFLKK